MKNNNNGTVGPMILGASLAAVAAAGIYFLYGAKNAKKYRSRTKAWMFTAKGEIIEALEKIEQVGEREYHAIVDMVTAKYQDMSHIDKDDIAMFAKDMKDHWKSIVSAVTPKARGKKTKK